MTNFDTVREALELATPHYQADTERFKQALAALAELEAENKRLRWALTQAVNNPYRSETESYERVMDEARAALEEQP